jgi:MYXO-CTERM domain-containing protein
MRSHPPIQLTINVPTGMTVTTADTDCAVASSACACCAGGEPRNRTSRRRGHCTPATWILSSATAELNATDNAATATVTVAASGGGGGCAAADGQRPVDPVLPALGLLGLIGLALRRVRRI